MTLIFLGVPFSFALAVLVRGALRTVEQWRLDRLARIDAPRPETPEAPQPAVRRPIAPLPAVRRPGPPRLG